MLQILGTNVEMLGKLEDVLEIQKTQLWGLRWDKGSFKFLHFTNTAISFTLPPSL